MNQVDEKIQTIKKTFSEGCLPGVSNQSFDTDRVVGNPMRVPVVNSQDSVGGGMTHLVHCIPRISFFSGKDPQ